MTVNVSRLREIMYGRNIGVGALSSATGISEGILYRRMKEPENFLFTEVKAIGKALDLTEEEFDEIFLL